MLRVGWVRVAAEGSVELRTLLTSPSAESGGVAPAQFGPFSVKVEKVCGRLKFTQLIITYNVIKISL